MKILNEVRKNAEKEEKRKENLKRDNMDTLKNRLEQELDVTTTSSDYGILLQMLSIKIGVEVNDLRGGKGSWTYKQWNEELKKY